MMGVSYTNAKVPYGSVAFVLGELFCLTGGSGFIVRIISIVLSTQKTTENLLPQELIDEQKGRNQAIEVVWLIVGVAAIVLLLRAISYYKSF